MTTTDQPKLEHDARCATWGSNDPAACTCRDESGHTPTDWTSGRLFGFDIESTGIDVETARVVTVTVLDIRPRKDPIVTNWLTDVGGEEVPAEAEAVHGISTEHARKHGRPIAEVINEVAGALQFAWECGVPVLGHNLGNYDLPLLAAECARLGLPEFKVTGPVIDSMILDRGTERYRKGKRTLTATCEYYGITLTEEDAHTSAGDALASARLAWKIGRKYPLIGTMPLPALQKWQQQAYLAWAENFGEYLVSQGKEDDVPRGWPMRGVA